MIGTYNKSRIEVRLKIRQEIIDKQEDGLASTDTGSTWYNAL